MGQFALYRVTSECEAERQVDILVGTFINGVVVVVVVVFEGSHSGHLCGVSFGLQSFCLEYRVTMYSITPYVIRAVFIALTFLPPLHPTE